MSHDCQICFGQGGFYIVSGWNQVSLWCPDCEPERFEDAIKFNLESSGRDLRSLAMKEASFRRTAIPRSKET